jgi:hypothetical protein
MSKSLQQWNRFLSISQKLKHDSHFMIYYQTHCNTANRYHSNVPNFKNNQSQFTYFIGVNKLYKCMHSLVYVGVCVCVCMCFCVTDELFMCIEDIWLCSER